jgi:putative ABC transport system ATP-binding protein
MGQTVAMVTHDPVAAAYADRVLFLADGRIVDEMTDPTADRVLERLKRFDGHGGQPVERSGDSSGEPSPPSMDGLDGRSSPVRRV